MHFIDFLWYTVLFLLRTRWAEEKWSEAAILLLSHIFLELSATLLYIGTIVTIKEYTKLIILSRVGPNEQCANE